MKRAVTCAVLVVTGCGRVGFAPHGGDAGGGPGGDVGLDDTSDGGGADTAIPCTPFSASLPGEQGYVQAAWLGDRYAVLISSGPDVSYYELSADGTFAAPMELFFPSTYFVQLHALAWNGTVLAIAATDNTAAYVTMYDPATSNFGATIPISSAAVAPQQVWIYGTGDHIATMYADSTTTAVRDVGFDGSLGAETILDAAGGRYDSITEAGGTMFATGDTGVGAVARFTTVQTATVTGRTLDLVTSGAVASIVASDAGELVFWQSPGVPSPTILALDPSGNVVASTTAPALPGGDAYSLMTAAGDGTHFAIGALGTGSGPVDLHVFDLDASATAVTPIATSTIQNPGSFSVMPIAVASGRRLFGLPYDLGVSPMLAIVQVCP